jgi:uncharacterized membrane protein YkvA (DUF1232 family)
MTDEAKRGPRAAFDPTAPLDPARALVPATVRVNEVRVQKGFWPKVRRVATKIPFARELLSVWYSARDDETPMRSKGLMLAGLAYFVLPFDVIPDVITGLGFTDDAAVLFALLNVVGRSVKPRHKQAADEALDRLRRD